jgi:NAD(P)-dependent dehydrogenase (short-subunit alcohol dehydrogenase family)
MQSRISNYERKTEAMKISDLFKVEGYGVVVTGGASGIGLGYAEALAANGARVTILDVHAQRIEDELRRLHGAGLDVRGEVVDVTNHKAAI